MKRNSFILKKLLPSLLSAAMVSGFGTPSFSLSTFAATSEPALSSAVNTPSDAAKATDSDAEYDEENPCRVCYGKVVTKHFSHKISVFFWICGNNTSKSCNFATFYRDNNY